MVSDMEKRTTALPDELAVSETRLDDGTVLKFDPPVSIEEANERVCQFVRDRAPNFDFEITLNGSVV